MKSGKQRRAELDAKKEARVAKVAAEAREKARVEAHAEAARRGTQRLEGKTYVVQDGDVLNVRFNV